MLTGSWSPQGEYTDLPVSCCAAGKRPLRLLGSHYHISTATLEVAYKRLMASLLGAQVWVAAGMGCQHIERVQHTGRTHYLIRKLAAW
jgi:urease beta subunit